MFVNSRIITVGKIIKEPTLSIRAKRVNSASFDLKVHHGEKNTIIKVLTWNDKITEFITKNYLKDAYVLIEGDFIQFEHYLQNIKYIRTEIHLTQNSFLKVLEQEQSDNTLGSYFQSNQRNEILIGA